MNVIGELELEAKKAKASAGRFEMLADALRDNATATEAPWAFPVGTEIYPPERWYAYTVHDLTGRRNLNGYAHSGIDLNLDKSPWGNVDVGLPVFAVTDGKVHDVGYSQNYRGGVVLEVLHNGLPLFVRYWHLRSNVVDRLSVGDLVSCGDELGAIDLYPGGWAHLHFDMAWQPFKVHWWHSKHSEIEWANPTYILKAHLDHGEVDAMMARDSS